MPDPQEQWTRDPAPSGASDEWVRDDSIQKPSFYQNLQKFAWGNLGAINQNLNPWEIMKHDWQTRTQDLPARAQKEWEAGDYAQSILHRAQSALPVVGPMLYGMGEASVGLSNRADQEASEGKGGQALLHQVEAGVPIAGPIVDQFTGAVQARDPAALGAAVGNVESIFAAPEAARLAGKAVRGAVGAPAAVRGFFKKDVDVAMSKAWGFTPKQEDMAAQSHEALAYIKKTGNNGKVAESNAEHIKAAVRTNKHLDALYDDWKDAARKRGATVDGNAVVQAVWDAIPQIVKDGKPKLADLIMKRTRLKYENKRLPVDLADTYRDNLTKQLKAFYEKSTGGKVNATDIEEVIKAERDTVADGLNRALDPNIDPQLAGARPREIRQMQARVIDLLDASRKRITMGTASKPVSQFAGFMGVLPRAAGSLTGPPGVGYAKAADIVNPRTLWGGSVDPWVRKAYQAVEPSTKTFSGPPPFQPRGLLGRGPLVTPSPAGHTFGGPVPTRVQPQWTQPPYRGVLPKAKGKPVTPPSGQPIITPPPAGSYPVSGPLPPQYPPGSGMNRLLGAPPTTQIQQPGFAVGMDMVPVTDPVTGQITYVPKSYQGPGPQGETLPGPEGALEKSRGQFTEPTGGAVRPPTAGQERAAEGLRGAGGESTPPPEEPPPVATTPQGGPPVQPQAGSSAPAETPQGMTEAERGALRSQVIETGMQLGNVTTKIAELKARLETHVPGDVATRPAGGWTKTLYNLHRQEDTLRARLKKLQKQMEGGTPGKKTRNLRTGRI